MSCGVGALPPLKQNVGGAIEIVNIYTNLTSVVICRTQLLINDYHIINDFSV